MKIKKILFIIIVFISINVYASDTIYNIDVNVYIDQNANASIEEIWKVKGNTGTEWYKPYRNLGDTKITNFTVSMDGIPLKEKKWNINESLEEKKGYYGINYNGIDTELCFGKYDFNEHTFTLKYNMNNYIFNTNDAQVLYWTYFSRFQNVDFQNMHIVIKSYYPFPDTLDVWGYGYKGYAYVKDGVIELSNSEDSNMNGNYVVALAKFPPETFITDYRSDQFNTFDEILNTANEDTFQYDYNIEYDNSTSKMDDYIGFGMLGGYVLLISSIVGIAIYSTITSGYGYKDNKKLKKKETLPFRDIPCNKDIYFANALTFLNNFGYQQFNILSAIILKWLKEGKIEIDNNNKIQTIVFKNNNYDIINKNEQMIFNMMYEASDNGVLNTKQFKKWTQKHYSKFLNAIDRIKTDEITRLKGENHIYKRKNKHECKKKNVMDDYLYDESKKLLGLKIFLEQFSSMKTKETIEVHLWDEYLMFASILGIADKVAKQLKNLYPEVYEQRNYNYNTIYFINEISRTTVHAASAARSAAQSYSSGGGGFSSGGGGGGSFGGGGFSGGGSR